MISRRVSCSSAVRSRHLRLEGFGLPTLLFVEEPHFQHVADPVQELFVLQRLGDKILGSLLEGPETDLGVVSAVNTRTGR